MKPKSSSDSVQITLNLSLGGMLATIQVPAQTLAYALADWEGEPIAFDDVWANGDGMRVTVTRVPKEATCICRQDGWVVTLIPECKATVHGKRPEKL